MTATPELPPDTAQPLVSEPVASRLGLALSLLDAALQAQREGSLDDLVRVHPRAARWLMRRHLRVVRSSVGDAWTDGDLAMTAGMLLRWLVSQLRPDAEPHFEGITEDAWLRLPAWRPLLAMAAVAGFLRVPDFPRVYRRRSAELPMDNLCGLWGVGPSTIYRTLERARHQMALLLVTPGPDALRRLSLRRLVSAEVHRRLGHLDEVSQRDWHRRQAAGSGDGRDPAGDLWHCWAAADAASFLQTLQQHAAALAAEPETDALVQRVAAGALAQRQQMDLWLARAALARTRGSAERELRACEQARLVAQAAQQPLLLGIVHSALGRYWEPRDADRAFACYQDSADFLRDLGPDRGDLQAVEHFVNTFARLAWLYVLRHDSRSHAVLERAEALRQIHTLPDATVGMLEQVWGEYWHRAGDHSRALEHRHRALNIFERLGDERSALATYLNIGFNLAARGDHARAAEYARRILDAGHRGAADVALVVGAHLNLGASSFWQRQLDEAIARYRIALGLSLASDLRLHAFRSRYNLAEAHYMRFRERGETADEQAGDAYVADALASSGAGSSPSAIESVRRLKAEILDRAPEPEPNRLLPGEESAHPDETGTVREQRSQLSVPGEPAQHARAHLAIARAYLTIAAKEREAALALIDKHGLQAQVVAELDALRASFERELTREQQLAAAWKQSAADIADDTRRAALIAHLLRDGAVNKSAYGELCGVAPATASKHLGQLTERGLLVQRGKGPATRYELPPAG